MSLRHFFSFAAGLFLSGPGISAAPLAKGMKLGIDFGPTTTAGWNNIVANNQGKAAGTVINLGGTVIDGVSITTANSNFVNNDGSDNWTGLAGKGGSAPPEFTDSVVTDIAGNFFGGGNDTPFRITLTGLDPTLTLRVDAVTTAANNPTDSVSVTGAVVHGPSAISRSVSHNQGLFHTFTGVHANASGILVIEVIDSSAGSNPIINGILISVGVSTGGGSDSDGDDLPDSWEITHFGNLAQNGAGDYDQDGDTNAAEYDVGTDPADIASNSGALKAWQIDFQGGPGGAFNSANPVTATTDIGYGGKWNAFQIAATNADVFANPPTNHNAVQDPFLENLAEAANQVTPVRLAFTGGASGFNAGRVMDRGGIDHAFGDHWFWGAQGLTSATLGFTFSNLPPGTYALTVYANPDQHNPPRGFGLGIGGINQPIIPAHGATFYANPGTFAATAREIVVTGAGTISGSLTTIGGDPSLGAMVLRQVASVSSAFAIPDSVEMNHLGKWRARVLANDVVFAPLAAVEIITPPTSGTATVAADGSVLYTHTSGTPATDSFRYRFTDASGVSNEADATITFAPGRVAPSSLAVPAEPPVTAYLMEDAFSGRGNLNFGTPTWIATIPGNNQRFFVSERTGIIWEIPDMSASPVTRRVFMDFTGTLALFTEMGVKSFNFHPDFENVSPYVYVTYNFNQGAYPGKARLSRFTATGAGLDTVDPASEQVLFEIVNRSQDHNIDSCRFGPDGYLYVGFGDERRPSENSQTITNMFWSSIIRIDVDRLPGNLEPNSAGNPSLVIPKDGGLARYKIPADNPYAATTGNVIYNGAPFAWDAVRSEIAISGVRNPWQISFDSAGPGNEIWVGDIGSDGGNSREEVNIFHIGDNGGWDHVEGMRFNRVPPSGTLIKEPEWSYARGGGEFSGASVTGGFVSRAPQYPGLDGKYLFGDWLNGHVWTLKRGASAGAPEVERIVGLSGIVGFGTDPSNGDILLLSWNSEAGGLFDGSGQVGKVFRLKAQNISGSDFPPTLSETGAFADLANMSPNPGMHFFEPNQTFWSDHAKKSRWFSVPAGQTLSYQPDDSFDTPAGAVWVKHFEMEMERGNPATAKRIETRFIVRKDDGGIYGISYKWNEAGTEATLVGDAGDSFDLAITDPSLPSGQQSIVQSWQIPSRSQCITCHNPDSGQILGFDSRQLNRDGTTLAGHSGNYLTLLANAGYLTGAPDNPSVLPRHHPVEEESASLESRVRSYLDVNCAYCHADPGNLDLRAHVDLDATGLLHAPDIGQIAINDPLLRRVVPGSPAHSSVLQRTAGTPGFNRMPPIASSVIDDGGVDLLTAWIAGEANAAPVIANASPVFVIQPASPIGTEVGTIAATDPDAPRDSVSFSIVNSNGLFAIDSTTGLITVAGNLAPLGSSVVGLEIEIADDFSANPRVIRTTATISTSGVNSPPRFRSPAAYHLPASLASGTRVGTVFATDPEGGGVTLQQISSSGNFTLDPASGEIRVSGALVGSTDHTLVVRASDGNATPATADLTITLHVVGQESSLVAAEAGRTFWNIDFQGDGSSTAAGQTTTPATATAGGMTWNAFQVKAYTGTPSAMTANPAMNLKTHLGGADTPVRFHIFTDNDPATPIGNGVYAYSGRSGLDPLVCDYLLLLDQAGANGPIMHEWEITGLSSGWQYDLLMQNGYDGGGGRGLAFTVDSNGDGDLADESPVYLATVADIAANSIVLRSIIADATGRIRGRSARTPPQGQTYAEGNWAGMQIRTSQSSPPVFSPAGPFAIDENAPTATPVGTVNAVDPEGTAVTYAIESGSGPFTIDPTSGQITVLVPPDFEITPVHILSVSATDADGGVSFFNVRIDIHNLPDTNADHVASWLTAPGGAFPNSTDPALIGFNADPDGDGISNAFEMLIGGNPSVPDRSGFAVSVSSDAGETLLHLDADVDATAADLLDFHAEHSTSLDAWQVVPGPPELISETGGRRLLRFTAPPLPGPAPRRFLRLKMNPLERPSPAN